MILSEIVPLPEPGGPNIIALINFVIIFVFWLHVFEMTFTVNIKKNTFVQYDLKNIKLTN